MSNSTEAVTPQNLDAEQEVLGWVVSGDKFATTALSQLEEADFYREAHKLIFRACKSAFAESQDCDLTVVTLHLRRMDNPFPRETDEVNALEWIGGAQYLMRLVSDRGPQSALEASVKELQDLGDLRRMLRAARDAQQMATKPAIHPGQARTEVSALFQQALATRVARNASREVHDLMSDYAGWHDSILNAGSDVRGARFGLGHVDEALGGLADHLLVVLKGLPKFGKSSLALQAAITTANDFRAEGSGKYVLVYALEDLEMQYMRRMVGHVGNIPNTMMRRGAYNRPGSEELKSRLTVAQADTSVMPILLDSASRNIDDLCTRAYVAAMQRPIGLVVVDYVQLLQGGVGKSEQELIGYQVSQLENLSKRLGCPIIATSQTTVKEDGSLAAKNSSQYDEKATVALTIWRGPLEGKMPMDERRRSGEVYVLCTHNRRDLAFEAKQCIVDYATDRWRPVSRAAREVGGGAGGR